MSRKKGIIKYKGELDLVGFKLPCYVLEDGTRVLSGRGMQETLKMVDEAEKSSGITLRRFLGQKSLKPFIVKEKRLVNFKPIICYDGNKEIHGYKADVLVDICNIYLEARGKTVKQGGKLPIRQAIIAEQCEILLRAFAKVGIYALIDEATGYQFERERFELNKILNLLVLKGRLFSKWKEMFPLGYYKDLFGVYDVSFTAENIRRKPRFIGFLTNELVYKNLPKGSVMLKEIKARTPKTKGGHYKKRFHQSLTPLGKKFAGEAINTVRTLAWVSGKDRNKFRRLVKERLQLERELPYIDIEAMDDNENQTKVDKVLGALLKTPVEKRKKKDEEE